jgi:hypothetical protein
VKGANFDFGGGDAGSINITTLDIPVMGRINIPGTPNSGFHLLFGPSFNFKLNESFDPDEADFDDDEIETFETELTLGAGFTVARFRVDARWGMGLTNIDKAAEGGSGIKNRIFRILFGFEL